MGEFFDAIYTRKVDAGALPGQLAEAARALNCCFLAAPEIQGWTGIYASRGQDGSVAKTLHKFLKSEVLLTMVHDGDIFCYEYYRDGKLVDEYNSRPDYFGKVSAKKRRSQAGSPELLVPLLRNPSDLGELERILHADPEEEEFDASGQLVHFAELLGLPNCATSYDYLVADEEDEAIERRGEFIHIPDLEPEKAARTSARQTIQAEMERMRMEGLLLFEKSPAPLTPVADPAGSGFITADHDLTFRSRERPIYRLAPPFEEGAKPLGIVTAADHHGVILSRSGRLLALIRGRGIEVWDRETGTRLAAMEAEPPMQGIRFLTDEKQLMVMRAQGLDLFSLPDGKKVRTIEMRVGPVSELHPVDPLMVVLSPRATVQVVDLNAGRVVHRFFLDSRRDLGYFQKMEMAILHAALGKSRRNAERRMGGMEAVEEEPMTAEDPRKFLFSPDGKYLICGTGKSAWVFRWRTLLVSGVETPPPLHRYRMPSEPSAMPMSFLMQDNFAAGVGALAYDAERNWVLLGCGDGVVRRMDLASGEVSTLLTVPGGNLIRSVTISADNSLLCLVDVSLHDMQNRLQAMMGGNPVAAAVRDDTPRERMLIWDYRTVSSAPGA